MESRIGDWNYDDRFRRLNLLIFINAMVGLVLAVFELEVAWMYSTEELTETGAIRRHLGEPLVSKLMKLTISILTIILMLQIFCLYRLQNHVKREIWGILSCVEYKEPFAVDVGTFDCILSSTSHWRWPIPSSICHLSDVFTTLSLYSGLS